MADSQVKSPINSYSTCTGMRYDCTEPGCQYETDDLNKLNSHYFRVHGKRRRLGRGEGS